MAQGVESQLLQIARFDQNSSNSSLSSPKNSLNAEKSNDSDRFSRVLDEQSQPSQRENRADKPATESGKGLPEQRSASAAQTSAGADEESAQDATSSQSMSEAADDGATAGADAVDRQLTEALATGGEPDPSGAVGDGAADSLRQVTSAEAAELTAKAASQVSGDAANALARLQSAAQTSDSAVEQALLRGDQSLQTVTRSADASTLASTSAARLTAGSTRGDGVLGKEAGASPGLAVNDAQTLADSLTSGERPSISRLNDASALENSLRTLGVTRDSDVAGITARTELAKALTEGARAVAGNLNPAAAGEDLAAPVRVAVSSGAEVTAPTITTNVNNLVQASAPSNAAPTSPTPEYALLRNPQDPQFTGELGARVKVLLREGVKEARLQLHPAELGRLQVTINTEGDQARVVFSAETAAARDAIEQSIPRLREMLEQNGLQLAHADVDQGAFGQAGSEQGDAGAASDAGALNDADTDAVQAEMLLSQALRDGRVDTYI